MNAHSVTCGCQDAAHPSYPRFPTPTLPTGCPRPPVLPVAHTRPSPPVAGEPLLPLESGGPPATGGWEGGITGAVGAVIHRRRGGGNRWDGWGWATGKGGEVVTTTCPSTTARTDRPSVHAPGR